MILLGDEFIGVLDFKSVCDFLDMMDELNIKDYVLIFLVIYDLFFVSYC